MSSNGVRPEVWRRGEFKVMSQGLGLVSLSKGQDGLYAGLMAGTIEVELPDGRRVILTDARSFRGRCTNARRGRSAKGKAR